MISTLTPVVDLSGLTSVTMGGLLALTVVALLITRELAVAAGPRFQPLVINLTVVLAPLAVVFAILISARLAALF